MNSNTHRTKYRKWLWGVAVMLVAAAFAPEAPRTVVCWGDSLTAPHPGCYPVVLQRLIGSRYNVVNAGVGGESTLTIMARQGAAPMRLAHDVVLYADAKRQYPKFIGNADITALESAYGEHRVTPLLQGPWDESSSAHVNPCRIGGNDYVLSAESQFWMEQGRYVFEYNYYLRNCTPLAQSDTLRRGAVVETQAMRTLRDAYANVFFMGQNGGFGDAAELIRQYRMMIDYSRCRRYVVIGFHRPNAPMPTVGRMMQMEDSLSSEFGRHYINLRRYLVERGLEDAGLQPTEADRHAMSAGQVPPQLLTDGTHFTDKGYALIARLVARRFRELGY